MSVVIDANVLATADGLADQASEGCMSRSVNVLQGARNDSVLIDADGEVLNQYRRCALRASNPSVAQEFLLYVLRNEYVEPKVQRVDLSPNDDRVYEEFPDDPGLAGFDRDDRVYVAIALASGGACLIQNATDRDWWTYKDALEIAGVEIDFICPELMHE